MAEPTSANPLNLLPFLSANPSQRQVSPEEAYRFAVANPGVPKVYGNSFINVIAAADFSVMFGHNGIASGVVTLSYPVAKALGQKIQAAISEYEGKTGLEIPALADIEAKIGPAQ